MNTSRKQSMYRILKQSEAEAIYSAMCALNNVSGKIKATFGDVSDHGINVFEEVGGEVNVVAVCRYDVIEAERYENQSRFAAAYDIG